MSPSQIYLQDISLYLVMRINIYGKRFIIIESKEVAKLSIRLENV